MPSTHVPMGLTALVLCGPGEQLNYVISPLKQPKALLPIANKPMLQYPLEWLLNGGITCSSSLSTQLGE